ncbi:biopolymer transporter ExbD [Methanobrevibacter sp. 87.7]|uniref:biopolymer transporter ExbD n=1 Tax=Methanobrevibacter sp. 87.7 TaxID=387957 RepID=UPI000B50C2AC|nr:biopolymer transporter ExbD [Methanobrevibacter sp. 87.7]OWT32375.1 biopolymer transporter ExbD [Methanobrevibacter sp. 87.7]
MSLDIKSRKERLKEDKININLVPFIDILFTILIFIVVTSSFASTAMDDSSQNNVSASGKPNVTDTSGNSEYYIFPVQGLHKVVVNGQDMSSYIKDDSIAIHSQVIDSGQINVDSKNKQILITTPPGMDPKKAVRSPSDKDKVQ